MQKSHSLIAAALIIRKPLFQHHAGHCKHKHAEKRNPKRPRPGSFFAQQITDRIEANERIGDQISEDSLENGRIDHHRILRHLSQ